MTEKTLPVAQCAVQSLIEMCAGNYDNQELAFKGQVVISIDLILKENLTSVSVSIIIIILLGIMIHNSLQNNDLNIIIYDNYSVGIMYYYC